MSKPMARLLVAVLAHRLLNVDEDRLMTLAEEAKRLGLSTSAMDDLIYRGALRHGHARLRHRHGRTAVVA